VGVVPEDVIDGGYTLGTPAGDVVLSAGDAGIRVASAPPGAQTAQTFYYAWSAFHPDAVVARR